MSLEGPFSCAVISLSSVSPLLGRYSFNQVFMEQTRCFVERISLFVEQTCRVAEETFNSGFRNRPVSFLERMQTPTRFSWFCPRVSRTHLFYQSNTLFRTDMLVHQTDTSAWNKYSALNIVPIQTPTRSSSTISVWDLLEPTCGFLNQDVCWGNDTSVWERHKWTRRFENYTKWHVDSETTLTDAFRKRNKSTSLQRRHRPIRWFRIVTSIRNRYTVQESETRSTDSLFVKPRSLFRTDFLVTVFTGI